MLRKALVNTCPASLDNAAFNERSAPSCPLPFPTWAPSIRLLARRTSKCFLVQPVSRPCFPATGILRTMRNAREFRGSHPLGDGAICRK